MAVAGNLQNTADRTDTAAVRRRVSVAPHSQPEDTSCLHPEDSDNHAFFAAGRDLESVYVNHKYTKKERVTLSTYESLDYLPPHSKVYRDWLKRHPVSSEWDRWFMMGLIGLSVGLIGFLMHQLIDVIAETKWNTAAKIIDDKTYFIGWIFVIGYSVTFALASTMLVVFVRPSAGGSGIPELIGFLNGTIIRHIFNLRTLIVKFISCVFAVGSGLPVGPEGPMIHLGSMIGAGLSQLRSSTLGINIPLFSRFRNSEDRRNFISAGAAAGVSSAFGAPVGGLLFAMEEVSSFWNMKLSWQTFFCCMVSTFTTDLLNSAFTAFRYQGDFGLFKTNKYILFAVTRGLDLNIIGIIPAILIGIIGGFSGSLFTFVNLKIQRIRRKLLSKVKTTVGQKICRIGEPVVIMIIFGTVSVLLPMSFSCTSYSCPVNNTGDVNQQECLLGTQSEDNVERYTCPRSKLVNVDGVTYRKGTYNQVATLLFLTGEQAIAHLFSRNTHFELDVVPLLVVFAIYFILSCWAAGSSISSGLVVPMLFIGALYGRIVGRIFVDLVGVHLHDYWAWIDPGAFALLGAASFFGGVSRLTMSLTVIMVELTNDIQFLLLIMTSVMVAKWVGDFVTHPLYHALLEFKCIPFLDVEPIIIHNKRKTVSLEMFTCRNVMTSPVVTVPTRDSVSHLAHLLLETTHSGFPVVRNLSPEMTSTFCGLITRLELSVLLQNPQIFLSEDDVEEDEPELLDVSYDKFCISKIADAKRINDLLMTYIENERYKNIYVNIFPYMNQSAVSIQGQFSLHRTYIIFRSLGLRHMTIVDDRNQVVGILTRKDLMGFMLEERLHNVLNCELRPTNHIV